MSRLAAAPVPDFDVYVARPDTAWLRRAGEPLEGLYQKGFLPYSGTKDLQNVFYSARSARVVLQEFAPTSENRRIARKFDGQFERSVRPIAEFTADEAFYAFCLSYFAQKHGAQAMPRARLETILNSGLITSVVTYAREGVPVAYVLEVEDGSMAHYWFSFYDLAYARQSLGLWLMLDNLRAAGARGLRHYYLGTVYGAHALYKTNFAPLEWWSGAAWSRDLTELKALARQD